MLPSFLSLNVVPKIIEFLFPVFDIRINLQLLQLFEWMLQNEKVSASSYSSYIKFMGKSLNPVKALEIYNNIQDESTKKNVHICNSVLGSLIRSGKFDVSFKLFDQMKQNGLTPDAVTYSTVCISMYHAMLLSLAFQNKSFFLKK